MMDFAPRQGRFAIVLLCSFCVLLFCFVWNAEYSAKRVRHEVLTAALVRLSDEVRLPLSLGDKVGLAVVAGRYYDEKVVKNLTIHDPRGALMLSLGSGSQESVIEVPVLDGERLLGQVSVSPKAVSRALIIQAYWPFLLVLLLGHIMLWLIYGYIARPTQKMQEAFKKQLDQIHQANSGRSAETAQSSTKPQSQNSKIDQNQDNAEGELIKTPKRNAGKVSVASLLEGLTKPMQTQNVTVVFGFLDEHGLFEMLSEDSALQYLQFCDEMLKKTLTRLLQTSEFSGVGVAQVDTFSARGAKVIFAKTQSEAKLALAATTTAKLMLMVFDEVYERQRKLGVFALPMRAFVCDDNDSKAVQKALTTQKVTLALALDESLMGQLGDLVSTVPAEFVGIGTPCYELKAVNKHFGEKLKTLKFEILTQTPSDNSSDGTSQVAR